MFDQDRLHCRDPRMFPLLLAVWLAAMIPAAQELLRLDWTGDPVGPAPAKWPIAGNERELTPDNQHLGMLFVDTRPLCKGTRATLKDPQNPDFEETHPPAYSFRLMARSNAGGCAK